MRPTSREASGVFTTSAVVGCCVGAITGAVTLIASDGGVDLVDVLPAIGYGAPFGVVLGFVLGLVLGVPIALVAGALRPVLPEWRGVGAGLAGVASGGVVATSTGLAGAGALPTVVTASLTAVGAWIGLGRIYLSES